MGMRVFQKNPKNTVLNLVNWLLSSRYAFAFRITLFLLQRPRPPDVLSVHVVVSEQLSVFDSRFLVNQDSYFVVKCISEF